MNNLVVGATDTNNPNGTATKPRRTIPTYLPAGSVVEVRGGPYAVSSANLILDSRGTAAAPVVIKGINKPRLQGGYGSSSSSGGIMG